MTKNTVISALVLCCLTSHSFSQEKEEAKKKNDFFYVGPFDLFFNTLQLGYEKKIKNSNTFALLGGFTLSKKNDVFNRVGGNAELQYRINLLYNKEAISLVAKNYSTFAYFAPYFTYRYEERRDEIYTDVTSTQTDNTYINSYFGGLGFGFRFTGRENRFCVNLFAGGGMKYSTVSGLDKYAAFLESGYTGIAPKVGFQMGVAF